MKDVLIKIERATSKVFLDKTVLGLSGENLQGNLIFEFDEFIAGCARLEVKKGNEKYLIQCNREDNKYTLPILSSLLSIEGGIYLQLVVTEAGEETPVFKSNMFYLRVNASIGAEMEIPEEYPTWIESANQALAEVENVDVDAFRLQNETTINLTNRKGAVTTVKIYDGDKGDTGATGPQGPQGEVGPQGPQGPQGEKGADGVMYFDELTPEQKESLKGDVGPKGDTGPQGPKGDTGPQGPKGDTPDLPIASNLILGGIKVGNNLSVDADGILSAAEVNNSYIFSSLTSGIQNVSQPDKDMLKQIYNDYKKLNKINVTIYLRYYSFHLHLTGITFNTTSMALDFALLNGGRNIQIIVMFANGNDTDPTSVYVNDMSIAKDWKWMGCENSLELSVYNYSHIKIKGFWDYNPDYTATYDISTQESMLFSQEHNKRYYVSEPYYEQRFNTRVYFYNNNGNLSLRDEFDNSLAGNGFTIVGYYYWD